MRSTTTSSVCPNSDPNFDKILYKFTSIHSSNYPIFRKKVYYFICIVIRLILYSLITYYKNKAFIPPLILLFSTFTSYHLYNDIYIIKNNKQWWSKSFQFIISILLMIVSILLLFKVKNISTNIIPLLLFISLFGGIIQSLFIDFC